MTALPETGGLTYLVLTAWHCPTCEVQGRSEEFDASCWNCGGTVVVTARPSIRLDDPFSSPVLS